MSSAILYVAIVAIWAVVLVPRWLRPRAMQRRAVPAESPGASWREPAGPGQDLGTAQAVASDGADAAGEPVRGEAMTGGAGQDVQGEDAVPEAGAAAAPSASRRSEVLKARRRLLITLIALTVMAVGLAGTHLAGYWIAVPPAALLTGYLVLLRQFAHIDTERARRAEARAGTEPVPATAPAVAEPDLGSASPAAPGGAEIIDISGRIGDQVYDQYSDPAYRAVGD